MNLGDIECYMVVSSEYNREQIQDQCIIMYNLCGLERIYLLSTEISIIHVSKMVIIFSLGNA